jgi:diketogulonate reductase-like aldo/keto reductase
MTPATTPTLKLTNGVTMPALGLGVYQSPPDETVPPSRPRCAADTG